MNADLAVCLIAILLVLFRVEYTLSKINKAIGRFDTAQWAANIELIGRYRNANLLQKQEIKELFGKIESLRKGFQA